MPNKPSQPAAGLDRVHVEGACDGLFLTLVFEHHYVNRSDVPMEFLYSFPIPSAAIILGFEATGVGTQTDIALRVDAEAHYEDAQAAGQFAVTIEQRAPGYCVASLGPVPAGTAAVLRLSTGQLLEVVGGLTRIAIPGVAAYPEGSGLGSDAGPAGIPTANFHAEYPVTLQLTLTGAAGKTPIGSPTHNLKITAYKDGKRVSLADTAALDRDIVILIDGLPSSDGAVILDPRGTIAVAALDGDGALDRAPVDLAILIDASGALSGATDGLPDLLGWLCGELEPGDQISITRIGRTAAPVLAPMIIGEPDHPPRHYGRITANLGDISVGGRLPPLGIDAHADLLLLTDGQTRTAEAITALAMDEKRRLFVLGLGSAPNEAWLRPRAEATGGIYVAIAHEEALEPAMNRMLGGVAIPPASPGMMRWIAGGRTIIPSWLVAPPGARSAHRCHIVAGFDAEPPDGLLIGEARCDLATGDTPHGSYQILAARRLPQLSGGGRAKWASLHELATRETAWTGRTPQEVAIPEPVSMTLVPQMIPAGWRGLGALSPVPPRPPYQEPPPRGPSGKLGLIAGAVVALGAGSGAWWLWQAGPGVPPSMPIRTAASTTTPTDASPGVAVDQSEVEPSHDLGVIAGASISITVMLVILVYWWRGRGRRR